MKSKHTLIAGIFAGLGASLCCAVPLVLLSLGLGGAWVANLTALEPMRPIFIGLTLFFIALSFRQLYSANPACEGGTPCADEKIIRRQRFIFWAVAIPLMGLLAFPWMAPLFY
jgi:mercuric ion transport protein